MADPGKVATRHPSRGSSVQPRHDPQSNVSSVGSGTRKVTFTLWVDQNTLESDQLLGKLILIVRIRGLDGQTYPKRWGDAPKIKCDSLDGFFPNFTLSIPVRKTGARLDGGTLEATALMSDGVGPGIAGTIVHCAPCPVTFASHYADHVFFAVAAMPPAYNQTTEHDHDGWSAKGPAGGDIGPVKVGGEVNTPKNSDKTTVTGPHQTPVFAVRLVETASQGSPTPK